MASPTQGKAAIIIVIIVIINNNTVNTNSNNDNILNNISNPRHPPTVSALFLSFLVFGILIFMIAVLCGTVYKNAIARTIVMIATQGICRGFRGSPRVPLITIPVIITKGKNNNGSSNSNYNPSNHSRHIDIGIKGYIGIKTSRTMAVSLATLIRLIRTIRLISLIRFRSIRLIRMKSQCDKNGKRTCAKLCRLNAQPYFPHIGFLFSCRVFGFRTGVFRSCARGFADTGCVHVEFWGLCLRVLASVKISIKDPSGSVSEMNWEASCQCCPIDCAW